MKKYKNILIVIAALVLCGVLAVSGSAMLQTLDVEDFGHPDGYANETAAKYLMTTDLFQHKVNLLYVDTVTSSSGLTTDCYVDEAGNEYRYDPDGTMRNYRPSDETAKAIREKVVVPTFGKVEALSETQAKEFAAELLRKFIGEDFENYKFHFIQNVDTTKTYYVGYCKYYKNNLIGENCTVGFGYDGTVRTLVSKGVGVMKNINTDILKDVSDEKINAFIAKQAKLSDSENESYVSHEINNRTILEQDGVYGIYVNTIVTSQTQRGIYRGQRGFFYPIPGQTGDVVK